MSESNPPAVVNLHGVCDKCRSAFEYQAHVTVNGKPLNGTYRHVCDACRAARKRWLDKKRKRTVVAPIRNRSSREAWARPGEFTSRRLISRDLGLSPGLVEDIERSALHKLRNSPELQEAFQRYQEDGMPLLDELAQALKTTGAELLIGYQLEVGDFWQVHDRMESEGLREEAQAVLEDIIHCQRVIARQLDYV